MRGWIAAAFTLMIAVAASGLHASDRHDFTAELTIAGLQARIASGKSGCAETVSLYLERIGRYDAAGLHAVSIVNAAALDEARARDREPPSRRRAQPLFCVPVLVKDNIDVAGMPTTAGSMALKDNIAIGDAPIIARLKRAGAIVLAHGNMAEWAFSPRHTVSSTVGETVNAYDFSRVPAGSSGGTASAVAANLAMVGLGTDTGNSIRGPSSRLALVGMRPTIGLVPLDGIVPLVLDRDAVGPMTRTVEDNARMLAVMANSAPGGRARHYLEALRPGALKGQRIGVLRALADPAEMSPDISRLFEVALADLRAAGATVVDITIPGLKAHWDKDVYCPRFRADVNAYLDRPGRVSPVRDVQQVFESGHFAPSSQEQFAFFLEGARNDCPDLARDPERRAFRADVIKAMDEAGVIAIAYPSWTSGPARIDRWREDYRGDNSQAIAPATGQPAITVPMGFDDDGLPAGLQLLGRPFAEAKLYGIAHEYERRTHHRRPPPAFPPIR
ncbi:Asp-tRNAAsn/Glu-tRNAGln amidotransferase A subunit [Novosphingobium sp. CF614]|uniref:amidase n=1 Tax=Novosphingobium sp. CF614 TaxID=1884364 RepID=UPI0008E71BC2|nr:amidase [Novosphingobium sp. CF614]SFG35854.1 Asp-tRNAAsn/Glu-tRNAGln amidotransferase A subunit [Novosphingobium sp. CF614]